MSEEKRVEVNLYENFVFNRVKLNYLKGFNLK